MILAGYSTDRLPARQDKTDADHHCAGRQLLLKLLRQLVHCAREQITEYNVGISIGVFINIPSLKIDPVTQTFPAAGSRQEAGEQHSEHL
ncbi:hypothetical protein D3C79_1026480 [compost metagenome]